MEVPDRLREAFADGDLVLYLGAGASVASGLPSWEKLILAMYFGAITEQNVGRPYANYLYAIAEWHLKNVRQPPAVVARKVRKMFDDDRAFTTRLRDVLYAADPGDDPRSVRAGNPTLAAVAELCEASPADGGVQAVISYNYDDLLETALGDGCFPVWGAPLPDSDAIPVYHVHGYLPRDGDGSRLDEILLTEEQYHRAAHEDYSWSNLVQLRYLTSSVGLMVGLSMTDQNMRRLLDAIARAPIHAPTFVLLQRPEPSELKTHQLDTINENAKKYYEKFELGQEGDDAGIKVDAGLSAGAKVDSDVAASQGRPGWVPQVQHIVHAVEAADVELNQQVLEDLGVEVVWYEKHAEVAEFLREIPDQD